jgi:hypothetical protein
MSRYPHTGHAAPIDLRIEGTEVRWNFLGGLADDLQTPNEGPAECRVCRESRELEAPASLDEVVGF